MFIFRRLFWGSFFSVGFLACGDAPPPPSILPATAPAAAAKPEPAPVADVTAVKRPAGIVVFARLNKPTEVLRIVGGWTQLPMPGAEAMGELLAGDAIGKAVDFSYPIDVAVALPHGSKSMKPMIAVSAGVRSLDDVKRQLAGKFKLAASENGTIRITDKDGDDDSAPSRPCSLVPSFGPATTRLICGDRTGAIDALAPYLARTAPRENIQSDAHVEVLLEPVRPLVQQFRGFLPGLAGGAMNLRMDSAGEALEAAVNDLADFATDLDKISFDLSVSDPAAAANITATFGGQSSLLARLALAHPERADVPPAAFWHLPYDADMAYFQRGMDPKELAHPKELLTNILVGALEKDGLPAADRKALTDATMHYLSLFTAPMVYGKGFDLPAASRAFAAVPSEHAGGNSAGSTEAERVALEQLGGWSVMQVDDPIAKVLPIAREWVAALARPAFAKWMKEKGTPAPAMKQLAVPKTAQLPADSQHFVLTVPRKAGGSSDEDEPQLTGQKNPKAAKAKTAAPLKPFVIHVFVVPDNGHTWLSFSGIEATSIAKARAVLATGPESGTLAKRTDLATIHDERANVGGFLSARGMLGLSPFRATVDAKQAPYDRILKSLQATKGQGGTPLPFALRAQTGQGGGGSLVMTARAPREAIEDIIKAAVGSGLF